MESKRHTPVPQCRFTLFTQTLIQLCSYPRCQNIGGTTTPPHSVFVRFIQKARRNKVATFHHPQQSLIGLMMIKFCFVLLFNSPEELPDGFRQQMQEESLKSRPKFQPIVHQKPAPPSPKASREDSPKVAPKVSACEHSDRCRDLQPPLSGCGLHKHAVFLKGPGKG